MGKNKAAQQRQLSTGGVKIFGTETNRDLMWTGADVKKSNSALDRFGLRLYLLFCFFSLFCFHPVSAQSLAALAFKLNRGNTEAKRDALFQIRNLKTVEAARVAVAALRDDSEIVRATAAQAVVFLPPDEALQALIPLLNDKSILARKEAAYALGKTRNAKAVRPLTEIIERDKTQEVKDAAVVALGEIGDSAAIETLTEILKRKPKNEEEFFRRAAARSVGQIAQLLQIDKIQIITPENFLADKSEEKTKTIYRNLTLSFPEFRAVVPVLIQILQNRSDFADLKREAAFAVGAIGDSSAAPVLQAKLQDPDYYLAEIAREALLKISPDLK